MYEIRRSKTAKADLKKIGSMSKSVQKRLIEILKTISIDPYSTEFGGEDLKHDYSGFRSFELTKKDRVVFTINEDENRVDIYQFLGHYDDK